ncbi:hypothetical protein PV04_09022 [Phialophora macrospora]|uniref:Sister chromatid cohesion protein Dcc1 n=1 Tax=Phialophora macrospora TaxID=1851006 RepID=A0A0D2DPD1_9EURO|nr:hypothetical protein PV04_09022 [Phialophora macrospora]
MASSQSSHFPPVTFSATVPQQSFRLLELSPELLDIIEAQRLVASERRRLWFKASTGSSSFTSTSASTRRGLSQSIDGRAGDSDKEGFLHLCSDEKIWAVKQVSTSNSVHVTRTISAEEIQRHRHADRDGDGDMLMTEAKEHTIGEEAYSGDSGSSAITSNGGITATAQVKNILELIEVKPLEGDVDGMLRDMVPFYSDGENEDDQRVTGRVTESASGAGSSWDNRSGISLQYVFDNVVAPTKTIFEAMKRLFIFGISLSPGLASRVTLNGQQRGEPTAVLFIPTASLLLKCWRVFMQQCAISEVHLDTRAGMEYSALRGLLDEIVESSGSAFNAEAELQTNVIVAILRHLSPDAGDYARYGRDGNLSIPNFHLPPDSDFEGLRMELPGNGDSNDATTPATGASLRLRLDPSKTRDLVGHWLLRSLGDKPQQPVGLAQFLFQWGELLPESWAQECDPHGLISGSPEWEIGKDNQGEEALRMCSNGSGTASSAAQAEHARSQARKRGKWHEKFGAQRTAAVKK